MSKKSKKKPELLQEKESPKKKSKFYLILGIGFILFFAFLYPSFTPILTKYTVVKHLTDKGGTIKDFEMSEVSFSEEKNFYIVTLTNKNNGQKREVGVSSKFFPTIVEYDIKR